MNFRRAIFPVLCVPSVLGAAIDFDKDVRPLLQASCVECHGEKKQKAELRLDTKPHAFKGGENGPVIVAGDSAKSPLFKRISTTDKDEIMPPKGEPLTKAQIALIQQWIDSGAAWPESDTDKSAAVDKRLKPELLKELSLEALVERKQVYAGRAKARVLERLEELKSWLGEKA